MTLRYRAGIYFKMPFKSRCCSRAKGALTQFKCTNARKCWLTNRPKCEHTLEQFYSGMYSILQQKTIPQLGLKIARACAAIFKGRPGLNCISTIVGLLRMKYSRSRRWYHTLCTLYAFSRHFAETHVWPWRFEWLGERVWFGFEQGWIGGKDKNCR